MLKVVYEINEKGFIIEHRVGELKNGELTTDFGEMVIVPIDYPPLYRPRWNGTEWVEGETEAERTEREATQQLESFLPSPEEITNAELEIKMIALLTELEVLT